MSHIYNPNSRGSRIITPGSGTHPQLPQSNQSRILPRQLSTGSTRGTQTIGYGNVKIDGSNNRISIGDTLGDNITIGSFPGNGGLGFGISISDSSNTSITLGLNSNRSVQMLFNDSQTNRLLIGPNTDGREVVWISKPGVDVTTAAESQLTFNSDKSFTVLLQDSYTFPSLGSVPNGSVVTATSVTIPHNAGFIPNVNFFTKAFLTSSLSGNPAVPSDFPLDKLTTATMAMIITQTQTVSGVCSFLLFCDFDENNLYLGLSFTNSLGTTTVAQPITVYYTVYTLDATG